MKVEHVQEFRTTDFHIAAFMRIVGYRMAGWERNKDNPKQLIFIFEVPVKENPFLNIQHYAEEAIKSMNNVINKIKLVDNIGNYVVDDEAFRKFYMIMKAFHDNAQEQKTLQKVIHNQDKISKKQ